MAKLTEDIKNHFLRYFFDEESTDDFTKWLYESGEVENIIGNDKYFSLIDIDYRQKDGIEEAKDIIKDIYNQERSDALHIDRAIFIAESMLNGLVPLNEGCRKLAHISADGHDYVDSVFIAYSDEFDRLGETAFYDERIINDVRKLLPK